MSKFEMTTEAVLRLEERLNDLIDHSGCVSGDCPHVKWSDCAEHYKKIVKEFILDLPELKGLIDSITHLRKEGTVGADGTRIKCTCGREGCVDFHCSAGDQIYTSSYANRIHPDEALTQWRSFIGDSSGEGL